MVPHARSEIEEAEGEVDESQGEENDGGEIVTKTELREALWNVGMGSGEVDIFCWGLYAENLPNLSPKLEYQVG